jgi:predicted nucleic acid-binding protein
VIFVDSNVPMYLVGASHPNRDLLEAFLRSHADEVYLTSAEVFQEVIHRYVAINRRHAIGDCFRLLDALVARVYPVTREDVDTAWEIASELRHLSGRDCLHAAVMRRHGIQEILSCDRDFASCPGVVCLPSSDDDG